MTHTQQHDGSSTPKKQKWFWVQPNKLKIVCIILNVVAYFCIEGTDMMLHSSTYFIKIVSASGFWCTSILYGLYLFKIAIRYPIVGSYEVGFCLGMTVLYGVASTVEACKKEKEHHAVATYGFAIMVVYFIDAYLVNKRLRIEGGYPASTAV